MVPGREPVLTRGSRPVLMVSFLAVILPFYHVLPLDYFVSGHTMSFAVVDQAILYVALELEALFNLA